MGAASGPHRIPLARPPVSRPPKPGRAARSPTYGQERPRAARRRARHRTFAAQEAARRREGRGVTCRASGWRREADSRPDRASPGLGAEPSEGGCGDELQQVPSGATPNLAQPKSARYLSELRNPTLSQPSPLPAKYKAFLPGPPSRLRGDYKSRHLVQGEQKSSRTTAHTWEGGGPLRSRAVLSFLGSGMRGAGGEGVLGLEGGRGGGGGTTLGRVGRIQRAGDNSTQQPAMQTPTQPPECFQAWKPQGWKGGRNTACALTFLCEREILNIIKDLVSTSDDPGC